MAVTDANPLMSVTARTESTAPAPLLGTTVKVTAAPGAGPLVPNTCTVKAAGKAAFIGVDCTAPVVAVTDPGRGPMLVRLKVFEAPLMEAVTT